MKTIKIILPIALIAIIGFFIWISWGKDAKGSTVITLPQNQYTIRIGKEIDSLGKASESVFCKRFYNDILYRITDYYKQGFLGKDANDNSQWQELLSKDLYSAYAPKFAEQAMYVFNGSEWKTNDINFIRNELKTLQNSNYLEQGSPVDNSFQNIHGILSKYDEIAAFIYTCNNFSFPYYDITISFPLDDVKGKIHTSKTYISNGLDNIYVNNCTRLKNGLIIIPQNLFNQHVNYLRSKIRKNSDRFNEFSSQPEYSDTIYMPLKSQIRELDNSVYEVSEDAFNSSHLSLDELLSTDNMKAYNYFYSQRNN
jgi:hypothetical protein